MCLVSLLVIGSGIFCDTYADDVAKLSLRKVQYCTVKEAEYWSDERYPFRAEAMRVAINEYEFIAPWDVRTGEHYQKCETFLTQAVINQTRQYMSGVWSISLKQIRPLPKGWFTK